MFISHQVLVECGGKLPHCTRQTPPCCILSPWAHTRCLFAADQPQHWSLSLHSDAAILLQHWEIWCHPRWLQLLPRFAGTQQKSAKPGPNPEVGASTKTAGRRQVSFECQLLELVALCHGQRDKKLFWLSPFPCSYHIRKRTYHVWNPSHGWLWLLWMHLDESVRMKDQQRVRNTGGFLWLSPVCRQKHRMNTSELQI